VTRNNNKIRNTEAVRETVNHSGSTDHTQYVVVIINIVYCCTISLSNLTVLIDLSVITHNAVDSVPNRMFVCIYNACGCAIQSSNLSYIFF